MKERRCGCQKPKQTVLLTIKHHQSSILILLKRERLKIKRESSWRLSVLIRKFGISTSLRSSAANAKKATRLDVAAKSPDTCSGQMQTRKSATSTAELNGSLPSSKKCPKVSKPSNPSAGQISQTQQAEFLLLKTLRTISATRPFLSLSRLRSEYLVLSPY